MPRRKRINPKTTVIEFLDDSDFTQPRKANGGRVASVVVPGAKFNRIEILEIITAWSAYYDRPYNTGEVKVRCLGADDSHPCTAAEGHPREFTIKSTAVKARYSCGCCRPERKPYQLTASRSGIGGRPVISLQGFTTDHLKVIKRIRSEGWQCQCKCGQLCIVPRSYQLPRGTITACPGCMPWQWEIKNRVSSEARKLKYEKLQARLQKQQAKEERQRLREEERQRRERRVVVVSL